MTTLIVLSTAAAPLLAIVGLFRLVGGIRGRRRRAIARQIALTDEIHRELLGAAAAPFVHQRGRSGWLVRVAVPLDSPPTVAAIVGIIQAFFTARDGAAATALEIVLTPRVARLRPATPDAGRPLGRSITLSAPRMVGASR
ncbi:MAG: hypothetical protein A2X51_04670 [Candidatus Rokubacteria bacterium GWC2_70_24]|nr:MAG: hypothetical protein A2X51_04670 [Candidatus Rokubacteria bacterium GWC2_70_24]